MKISIMQIKFLLFFLLISYPVFAQQGIREIKITQRYLNLPVQEKAAEQRMEFSVNGKVVRSFEIGLSGGGPGYWVFADVSAYKGKILTLHYPAAAEGLQGIYQSDRIAGADSLYREKNRPQFHFTSRRGWNNDPNGLVYYKGEYHLFYQHNPFGVDWGNMTWGHAVSRDLLHWKELKAALYPDKAGTMFSGSAAVDSNNSSGFQTDKEKVLVAAYTCTDHEKEIETQCIAFSNDRGRTWTKYSRNPVINSKARWDNSQNTRDPRIFWYGPTGKWVMVLFEKDGNSIYNSDNLKEWVYQSHIPGFFECPELFQLPVDKDTSNKKWVMYDGSGAYLVGDFDGRSFRPESGKRTYFSGKMYAAQTFNDIPVSDGRRIQIGWGSITHPGMPFNQMMTFPTQLTLRTTADGVRLFSEPIAEIAALHKKAYRWKHPAIAALNKQLQSVKGDLFHIKMTLSGGSVSGIRLDGNAIMDTAAQRQLYEALYGENHAGTHSLMLEILVDRTSVEIFADKGRFSLIEQREPPEGNRKGIRISAEPGLTIDALDVFEMKSIWQGSESGCSKKTR